MDSDPDLPPLDHGGSDDPNPSLDHEPVAAEVEGSSNGEGNQQRGRNGSVPSDLCSGGEIEIEEEEENQEKGFRSPRNSGCYGEGGISEASGGIEEADDGRNSAEIWARWKHRRDEDDASASWRKRKKHFFVLSHSGKPIYSRYGDEHKLAGFSATLHAIISAIEIRGDHVKLIRAGNHQVVFLVKGPIYLVCISCTKEPCAELMGQLELIYGQMLLILTKSIDRCFEKNPNYDMTPLLQGTDPVFSSLVHAFSWNPATFLHAYACLPLPYATRQAAGAILQDAADSGILFAVLMCKHKVICLVRAQDTSLHPDDMLLLSNFILSSESFRTTETFSPICLPRYNPMAFLYAYIHFFDVDTYLTLLTTSSEAFYYLRDCRIRIEKVLSKSKVLIEIQRSILEGGLFVEDLPFGISLQSGGVDAKMYESLSSFMGLGAPGGLWHFIYKSIYLDQYVSSEFSPPVNNYNQRKRLLRAYQRLYASMHDRGNSSHKTQFRRDKDYVLLCWITQDFELYAAFDPLAHKALAVDICNKVCQWVKDLENEIFFLGASPFSW